MCKHNPGNRCACISCNTTDCSNLKSQSKKQQLICHSCIAPILCDKKECEKCNEIICDSCQINCFKCKAIVGCRSYECNLKQKNRFVCFHCCKVYCPSCTVECSICKQKECCLNTDCNYICKLCNTSHCYKHLKTCSICDLQYCSLMFKRKQMTNVCDKCWNEDENDDINDGEKDSENDCEHKSENEEEEENVSKILFPNPPQAPIFYYGLPSTNQQLRTSKNVFDMLQENFNNDETSDSEFEKKTVSIIPKIDCIKIPTKGEKRRKNNKKQKKIYKKTR